MQIVYDLKTYLAQCLTQQLGTVVDPAAITIDTTEVTAGGVVIRPKVNGVVHELNLAKRDLATLYQYVQGKPVAGGNIAVNVLKSLSEILKISLHPDMFEITSLDSQTGVLAAKAANPVYSGGFEFDRSTKFAARPFWFWPLAGNRISEGTDKTQLADNFKFVSYLDKTWATLKDGQLWADLGVNITFATNVTITFDLVASDLGNMYGNIFSSRAESSIYFANYGMFTGRNLNNNQNKWGLYGLGYGQYTAFPTTKLGDTPVTITIVKAGTNFSLYENGILRWTFTGATGSIWRYFGSLNRRNRQYLRNLAVWNAALSDAEVVDIVNKFKLMP